MRERETGQSVPSPDRLKELGLRHVEEMSYEGRVHGIESMKEREREGGQQEHKQSTQG